MKKVEMSKDGIVVLDMSVLETKEGSSNNNNNSNEQTNSKVKEKENTCTKNTKSAVKDEKDFKDNKDEKCHCEHEADKFEEETINLNVSLNGPSREERSFR